jgi:hypothetical protein
VRELTSTLIRIEKGNELSITDLGLIPKLVKGKYIDSYFNVLAKGKKAIYKHNNPPLSKNERMLLREMSHAPIPGFISFYYSFYTLELKGLMARHGRGSSFRANKKGLKRIKEQPSRNLGNRKVRVDWDNGTARKGTGIYQARVFPDLYVSVTRSGFHFSNKIVKVNVERDSSIRSNSRELFKVLKQLIKMGLVTPKMWP